MNMEGTFDRDSFFQLLPSQSMGGVEHILLADVIDTLTPEQKTQLLAKWHTQGYEARIYLINQRHGTFDKDRFFQLLPFQSMGDLKHILLADVIDTLTPEQKTQLLAKWHDQGYKAMTYLINQRHPPEYLRNVDRLEFDTCTAEFRRLITDIRKVRFNGPREHWEQYLDLYKAIKHDIGYWLGFTEHRYKEMMGLHDLLLAVEACKVEQDKESLLSEAMSEWKLKEAKQVRKPSTLAERQISAVSRALRSLERHYPSSELLELYTWLENLWEEDDESEYKELCRLRDLCYSLLPVPSYKPTKGLSESRHLSLANRLPPKANTQKHVERVTELMFQIGNQLKVNIAVGSFTYCPIKWCEQAIPTATIYQHFFNRHRTVPTWEEDDREEYNGNDRQRQKARAEAYEKDPQAGYDSLRDGCVNLLKSDKVGQEQKDRLMIQVRRCKHIRDKLNLPEDLLKPHPDITIDPEASNRLVDDVRQRLLVVKYMDLIHGAPSPTFGDSSDVEVVDIVCRDNEGKSIKVEPLQSLGTKRVAEDGAIDLDVDIKKARPRRNSA